MNVHDRKESERILVLGHRGSPNKEVENTIASFKRAILEGADGVELDVHLTADEKIIVIHDFTTKRVFGTDRRIEELTREEVKAISKQIPTLDEVFDELGPVYYDIEIKAEYSVDKKLIEKLTTTLDARKEYQDRIMVSSFNPLAMRAFERCNKGKYPLGIIYDGPPTSLPVLLQKGQGRLFFHADFLKPKWDIAKREKESKPKYPIIPWTVDKKEILLEMVEKNAPIIITNEPELIVKALQEEGLR